MKNNKDNQQRLRLILKSKLTRKNKITATNACALAVYRPEILQQKESELKDLGKRSRKTMTMYGALHPKSNVERLYIKRKEGGRCLISVERSVREGQNSLDFYVANSKENLLKGVAAAETINTEDTVLSEGFRKQKAQELKQNWREKRMHGQFFREIPEKFDKDKTLIKMTKVPDIFLIDKKKRKGIIIDIAVPVDV